MSRHPVPLCREQIEAACRLHAKLSLWRAADQALEALGQRFPGFQDEAALLKVVTINSLYGTNVYAVARMARHVESVMAATNVATGGPDLVERLADLPKTGEQERSRRFRSFASKFAHFFIDSERFPILDSYAASVIKLHLGATGYVLDPGQPYRAYVANFQKLRQQAGWLGKGRELDRYLWIAGQYRAYQRRERAQINTELRQLFDNPPPEITSDLGLIAGKSPGQEA